MSIPAGFTAAAGHARHRLAGTMALVDGADAVGRAIAHCRAQRIARLLVDAVGLDLAAPPTIVDRFLIVEDWARASQGRVIVAVAAPAAYIHPARFGVKLAADLGERAEVFTAVEDALAWLLVQP
jgi:hypothetical protein